jgi:hypothetical protein
MSHLHRQLAAQAAIAADKDCGHPATPVLPKVVPAAAPVRQAKKSIRSRKARRKA